jgi:hypothetical protein
MTYWRRWQNFIQPIWGYRGTRPLIAAGLYAIFTIILTHPVAWNLSAGIMGHAGDSYQHLWLLWWGEKAILDNGTTLAMVDHLYYPLGAYHPILWVTPWIQLAALPLVVLFGPIAAYNLGFILGTILAGLFAYLLAYEVTRNHYAAFVGGLIFAFAPTRFIHAIGHYAHVQTYLFPLFLFFLIRLLKKPTWQNSLLTGVSLAAASLVNFLHLAYTVIPSTLIIVGYYMWHWRLEFWRPQRFMGLAGAAVLAFILVSPFFYPFLKAQAEQELSYLGSPGVSTYGNDLLAFITPSPLHPALKEAPALRQRFAQITNVGSGRNNITEGLAYMGILPLLLAGWAILRQRQSSAPWFWLALITAVLSIGPLLWVNGQLADYTVDGITSYVIMPYAILTRLPLFEFARTPGRLSITVMMAFAVLVGLGVKTILDQWSLSNNRQRALVAGFSLFILFEYIAIWPFPMAIEPVPDFYDQIAQESSQSAVLDYPVYLLGYQSAHSHDFPLYYQLVHERPIVGGYVWRMPPETVGTLQAFHNLLSVEDRPDIIPLVADNDVVKTLAALDIGYVVVHKYDTQVGRRAMPPEQLADIRNHFAAIIGEPVYEDGRILAYPIPQTTEPGDYFMTAVGANWFNPDYTDKGLGRWSLGRQSELYVYGELEQTYQLSFWAEGRGAPRSLAISINDQEVGAVVVDNWRQIVLPPLQLNEKINKITFQFAEPCELFGHPYGEEICAQAWFSQVELLPINKTTSE